MQYLTCLPPGTRQPFVYTSACSVPNGKGPLESSTPKVKEEMPWIQLFI